MMEKAFQKVTQKLDSFLEMGVPFYDCIVMRDGKCVYRHANGFTDAAKKKTVTGKEKYNIYSCSKLITCVAALQLWEKGLYSLDDKLSDYMPEFECMTVRTGDTTVAAEKPILIRHLFTMTAGFSYDLSSPQLLRCRAETNGTCPTRETMRYLAKEPLLLEPGTSWKYSLCHDVLAALVEVLSGVSFGEYVKRNIFDPLEMHDSTFLLEEERLDEMTPQFVYDSEKGIYERDRHIVHQLGTKYESGGAGCVSTVDDYIKFIEASRVGDKILKKETVAILSTDQLTSEQAQSYWYDEYGYGLGQRCPKDARKSDFGWGGAAGCYYAIDPKNRMTFFMATHILGYQAFLDICPELTPVIQESLQSAFGL